MESRALFGLMERVARAGNIPWLKASRVYSSTSTSLERGPGNQGGLCLNRRTCSNPGVIYTNVLNRGGRAVLSPLDA
jgi:hypothetical protein